jgi:hypothetical protein
LQPAVDAGEFVSLGHVAQAQLVFEGGRVAYIYRESWSWSSFSGANARYMLGKEIVLSCGLPLEEGMEGGEGPGSCSPDSMRCSSVLMAFLILEEARADRSW